MSKQRYIDTIMWRDEYFYSLNPSEKLLFIYLITNPDTNIAGVYQLPRQIMSTDSGFNLDTVNIIMEKFTKDKKIYYFKGWVIICNFPKHQKYKERSKIKQGIDKILNDLPNDLKKYIISIPYLYESNYYDSNMDIDSDIDKDTEKPEKAQAPNNGLFDDLIKSFEFGYEKLNHEKLLLKQKDYIVLRNIIKDASKYTDNSDEIPVIVKNKVTALYQKCLEDKKDFWNFTPGKLQWGWNELVYNEMSRLKDSDPFEFMRRLDNDKN